MKIIVWGINYSPEKTGIAPCNAGLCEFLAGRGHELRMLTAFPYYPEWRKKPEDRGRLFRTDCRRGVRIHRCWHYVPRRPNAWKRIVHEATFVLTSFLRALVTPRADVVVIVSPPLPLGVAAWALRTLKRSPYLMHVQDLQPDAAIALGLLKPGALTRTLHSLERFAYRHAAVVSAITPTMVAAVGAKGVPAEKRWLVSNWAPEPDTDDDSAGDFRTRHGLARDTFLAVYSGNLGKKQGLEIIPRAARILASRYPSQGQDREIRFVIAGDGVEKAALATCIEQEALSNVMLLPLQSGPEYQRMLLDADVCLVTQRQGSGNLFFPSKLLSILARGRPVIASADPGGELERAVLDGRCGWCVSAGDTESFAAAISNAAGNPGEAAERGRNGYEWVQTFRHATVLSRFESSLVERFSPEKREVI